MYVPFVNGSFISHTLTMTATKANDARSSAHSLEIVKVIEETSDAVSIVFDVPSGSEEAFAYTPGQFLTLRIPHGDDSVSRCYSLSSTPSAGRQLQVTVKRVDGGRGSNWLCDNATAGMRLDSLRPGGMFTPTDWADDFVLVAAGSGITPIMSILQTALAEHTNTIRLVYANRDEESVIFADQLRALTTAHPTRLSVQHWLESTSGLPTDESLRKLFGDVAGQRAFICGPAPFMEVARQALSSAGASPDMIHKEVFVSLNTDAFATRTATPTAPSNSGAVATVDLEGEVHTLNWPRDQVLLDVLLDNDLDAPYVCREGNCGGCAYSLRSGVVTMLVNDTLDQYELDRGVRLACQSIPETDELDIAFDR